MTPCPVCKARDGFHNRPPHPRPIAPEVLKLKGWQDA
jgi:hypothetical protein